MALRFYNGGNADDLTLPYSVESYNPISKENEFRNAYYPVRIKEKDFFEVPESIRVKGKQYFTNFEYTVPTRKGHLGVVRVDPDAKETDIVGPLGRIAKTDEEAKVIGDRVHEDYLIHLIQDYRNRVEDLKAQGLHPLPAQGYVKYALEKMNIQDPAEPVRSHVTKATESTEITALKKEMEELKKLIKKNA